MAESKSPMKPGGTWLRWLSLTLAVALVFDLLLASLMAGSGSLEVASQLADTGSGLIGIPSFALLLLQIALYLHDRSAAQRADAQKRLAEEQRQTVNPPTGAYIELGEVTTNPPGHLIVPPPRRAPKWRKDWPAAAILAVVGCIALVFAVVPNTRTILPSFPSQSATVSEAQSPSIACNVYSGRAEPNSLLGIEFRARTDTSDAYRAVAIELVELPARTNRDTLSEFTQVKNGILYKGEARLPDSLPPGQYAIEARIEFIDNDMFTSAICWRFSTS
jgi:hypothetical protein